MRRPLCVMCLAFVGIVFLILQLMKKPPESPEDLGGQPIRLSGRVYQKEIKNEKSVIYLKQISWEKNSPQSFHHYLNSIHNLKVLCYIEEELPELGSHVEVEGKIRFFEAATNPGEFDVQQYQQILGISFQLQNASILARSTSYDGHKEALYRIRERLWDVFAACLPEKEAGIMGAMMLGRKETLAPEMKDLYRISGISHILAISGLHITLLGMGFYKGLRRLALPIPISASLGILLMCEYGQMTGLGTSTMRAVLMFFLLLLGQILGRTYDLITAAALSCVLLLCSQPLYLYNSGFLLSFGAVMGIALVSHPLQELNPWKKKEHPLLSKFGAAILSGLGIQLATLPILLATFYEYPLYSILLNLIVVPLMSILFLDGLLGLLLGMFFVKAGFLCLIPGRLILGFYEGLAELTVRLPGSRIITGKPQLWQIMLYYLLLAGVLWLLSGHYLLSEKCLLSGKCLLSRQHKWIRKGSVLLLGLGVFLLGTRFDKSLKVTMLDIGQGDACVIQTAGGKAVLIDGGSSSKKNIADYQMLPYLKYNGIDCLDTIFISHMDADHMNGLTQLMELAGQEGIRLGSLVVAKHAVKDEPYYEILRLAKQSGMKILGMETGERLRIDEVEFSCLYPDAEPRDSDRNNSSLILKMEAGEWRAIFMGDLGFEMEPEVMEYLKEGEPYDMLKVGHHGSNTSTSLELLEKVRPHTALISCGRKNSYGHPGKDTLDRLGQAGSKVFITAESGAIEMQVLEDGKKMRIHLGK